MRLIALLSAFVLLASACGGGAGSETGARSVSSGAPSGAATTEAEAGSGPDLGLLGQGSLEGQDVVVWFWAEW